MLKTQFFNRDPIVVAKALLGKVIRVRYRRNFWLAAKIIETEAYYLDDKASHASLGYTEKRKALFMPAGTIYMYYSRGGDSLNVSCKGAGNAVLIKAAVPYFDAVSPEARSLKIMQRLNPNRDQSVRSPTKLCNGQTLLCKSLGLKVPDFDGEQFDLERFYIEDCGCEVGQIIQTKRLGIPCGRDAHLPYRFIDFANAAFCTKNPLSSRQLKLDKDYALIT